MSADLKVSLRIFIIDFRPWVVYIGSPSSLKIPNIYPVLHACPAIPCSFNLSDHPLLTHISITPLDTRLTSAWRSCMLEPSFSICTSVQLINHLCNLISISADPFSASFHYERYAARVRLQNNLLLVRLPPANRHLVRHGPLERYEARLARTKRQTVILHPPASLQPGRDQRKRNVGRAKGCDSHSDA